MGKSKGGYYAVQNGRETGVFSNWNDCKDQVSGYSGASFKRFDTFEAAQQFSSGGSSQPSSSSYSSGGYTGGYQSTPSSYSSYSPPRTTYKAPSASVVHTASYGNNYGVSGTSYGHSSKPKPVYAVAKGRNVGVYNDWQQCKQQVDGFNNAVYKKFDNAAEARRFVENNKSEPAAQTFSTGYLSVVRDAPQERAGRSNQSSSSGKSGPYYSIVFKNGDSKIVNSWDKCSRETKGVQGVTFKKFDTLQDAQSFVNRAASQNVQLSPKSRQARTEEFLNNNSSTLLKEQASMKPTVVYCDGSFIPGAYGAQDKAGYGVYYGPDDPRNVAQPLNGPNKNSFISEVKATAHVLKQIRNEIDDYKRHDGSDLLPKYVVSSDSETVKNILDQYAHSWTDKEFQKRGDVPELKEMVNDYKKIKDFYNTNAPIFGDHKFGITWVKGHSGIDGNENADRLARLGAERSTSSNASSNASWW